MAIGEANLLSSTVFNNNDLQNKQVISRSFMYKCFHRTIRPALPRDFFASNYLQNKQVIGRSFMYKCSHPTVRPALPRDFFALPKNHAFFLDTLNWIPMEVHQNNFGISKHVSLPLK